MSVFSTLIAYFISFVICLVIPLCFWFLAKKRGNKLHWLHFFFGLLMFILFAIGCFLLLKYHLNVEDGITDYFNTPVYRITIIALISILCGVLLWIFAMKFYVKQQSLRSCWSFFIGFGISGVFLLGVYALFMFLQLLIYSCFNTLIGFDTVRQAFQFAPDTYIFVFQPIFGHISYSVTLISFLFISVCFAFYLNKLSLNKIPFWASLVAFFVLVLTLTGLVSVTVFSILLGITHYWLAIISVGLDLITGILVCLLSRARIKSETGYNKQFE